MTVVQQIPVATLATGPDDVVWTRSRTLSVEEITEFLNDPSVRLIVADVGKPLEWVEGIDRFRSWEQRIKGHVVEPGLAETGFFLEDFPGSYAFVVSLWRSSAGTVAILLEKHH